MTPMHGGAGARYLPAVLGLAACCVGSLTACGADADHPTPSSSLAAQNAADHVAEIVSTSDGVLGSLFTRLSEVSTADFAAELIGARDAAAQEREREQLLLPGQQRLTAATVPPGVVAATQVECARERCTSNLFYQPPAETGRPATSNAMTLELVDGVWKLSELQF